MNSNRRSRKWDTKKYAKTEFSGNKTKKGKKVKKYKGQSDSEDETVRRQPILQIKPPGKGFWKVRELCHDENDKDKVCVNLEMFDPEVVVKVPKTRYYKNRLKNYCLCLGEILSRMVIEMVRVTSYFLHDCSRAFGNCCAFFVHICQLIPYFCFCVSFKYFGNCAICRPFFLFSIVQSIFLIGILFIFIYSIFYVTVLDNLMERLGYSNAARRFQQELFRFTEASYPTQLTFPTVLEITTPPDLAVLKRNTWTLDDAGTWETILETATTLVTTLAPNFKTNLTNTTEAPFRSTTLEAEDTSVVFIESIGTRHLVDIPLPETEVYDEKPMIHTRSTSNLYEVETTVDFLSTLKKDYGFILPRTESTESLRNFAIKALLTRESIPVYSEKPTTMFKPKKDYGFILTRPEYTKSPEQGFVFKARTGDTIFTILYIELPTTMLTLRKNYEFILRRPESTESPALRFILKALKNGSIITHSYNEPAITMPFVHVNTTTTPFIHSGSTKTVKGFKFILHRPQLTELSDSELAKLRVFTRERMPSFISYTPIPTPSVDGTIMQHRSEKNELSRQELVLNVLIKNTIIPSIYSDTPTATPFSSDDTITERDFESILTRPEPSESSVPHFVLKAHTEDTVTSSFFSDTPSAIIFSNDDTSVTPDVSEDVTMTPYIYAGATKSLVLQPSITNKAPFAAGSEITTNDPHHATTTSKDDFGRTILDFGYIVQNPEPSLSPEKSILLKVLQDTIFPPSYNYTQTTANFVNGSSTAKHVTHTKVSDIKNLIARIEEMVKNTKETTLETKGPVKLSSISNNKVENLLFDRTIPVYLRTQNKPRTFFAPGSVWKKLVFDKLAPLGGYVNAAMFMPVVTTSEATVRCRAVISETPTTTKTASLLQTTKTRTAVSEATGTRDGLPWTLGPVQNMGRELGFS